MRKRYRIMFALLILTVIGGIAWLTLRPGESDPVYKGKRLSVWLEAYEIPISDPAVWTRAAEAEEAVRSLGSNAVPTLLRRLRSNDSPLKLKLVALAKKQHVFKIKFRSARMLHEQGVNGFAVLGDVGKAAVPELIKMYEDTRFPDSHNDIAAALGDIGPAAEEAVPALVRSLGERKWIPWCFAAFALGRIHRQPEIALPALIGCLDRQDPNFRQRAALTIGAYGPDAKPAFPALLKLRSDPDIDVRRSAKAALKEIDPEAAAKAGVK